MKRRLLLQGSLVLGLLLTSVPSAIGSGPPGTASANEEGRGIAHQSATIDVPAYSTVVVQKFVLPPGFSGLWPAAAGDTLILAKQGALATFLNCAEKQMWETGQIYLRAAGDPKDLLVKNEGKDPAELIVTFFNAPPNQPKGAMPAAGTAGSGCAPRGSFTPTEMSRVVNYTSNTLEMEQGKLVVMQSFLVEPGFNFWWHRHPGPTIVLQRAGTIMEYMGCAHKLQWDPGYAYIHTPGHHGHSQETAKNEGKDTADFIVIFFNVPDWHPAGVPPRNVEPPPTECPTTSLA
jgi:hypothetical protein